MFNPTQLSLASPLSSIREFQKLGNRLKEYHTTPERCKACLYRNTEIWLTAEALSSRYLFTSCMHKF